MSNKGADQTATLCSSIEGLFMILAVVMADTTPTSAELLFLYLAEIIISLKSLKLLLITLKKGVYGAKCWAMSNTICEQQKRRSACSLISVFVVHCQDSIMPIVALPKFSRLASFDCGAGRFESDLVRNIWTGFLMMWLIFEHKKKIDEKRNCIGF